MQPDAILFDEQDGREAAARLGLPVTGILGVLLRAKKGGRINSLQKAIEALRSEAGFFIAKRLEALLLAEAGELSG